jgi:hypothetical protein
MKAMLLPRATRAHLLSGEAWVAYSALSRLGPSAETLSQGEAKAELEAARRASVASPLVQGLIHELKAWPGQPLASHKSAQQLFHRLAFAAELGLRRGDPGAEGIARAVMKHRSEEGPFDMPMNIGEAHGGSGEDQWAWALCDAPVTLRALARMGWAEEPSLRAAVDHLVGLRREIGWPCASSKSLGFRGPGKKSDPCPYATLVMLELLLENAGTELKDLREAIDGAAECLLDLWEHSREEHPYIFYMGDDFRKLKAPLLWYDLLHVLEALSKVEGIREDRRLGEMLDILQSKAGDDVLFRPESVYLAWKALDFGQKKEASPYLSAIALGILHRTGRLRALSDEKAAPLGAAFT